MNLDERIEFLRSDLGVAADSLLLLSFSFAGWLELPILRKLLILCDAPVMGLFADTGCPNERCFSDPSVELEELKNCVMVGIRYK